MRVSLPPAERSPAGAEDRSAAAEPAAQMDRAVAKLLTEMTTNLRRHLPAELKGQIDPKAPRKVLGVDDTARIADGFLPKTWYERAAQASGPPSLHVRAMEAPGPGLRWPGGAPQSAAEGQRLFELQVYWLGRLASEAADPAPRP
jgi:hypothetical protein